MAALACDAHLVEAELGDDGSCEDVRVASAPWPRSGHGPWRRLALRGTGALAVAAAAAVGLLALRRRWGPAQTESGIEVVIVDEFDISEFDPRLYSYWDKDHCGPGKDDQNMGFCTYEQGSDYPEAYCQWCPDVPKSVCPSGLAHLRKQLGRGGMPFRSQVRIDGCDYGFFAVYVCDDGHTDDAPKPKQLPDPTTRCPPNEPLLYIGIESAPENTDRRNLARKVWVDETKSDPVYAFCVVAEFVIGHPRVRHDEMRVSRDNIEAGLRVVKEAEQFGDVRLVPLAESYDALPDKDLLLIKEGLRRNARFIVKLDDDQRFLLPKMFGYLHYANPTKNLYAASHEFRKDVGYLHGVDGKFVPYLSGGAWMLSRSLVEKIVETDGFHTMDYGAYGDTGEDIDVGRWVAYAARKSKVQYLEIEINWPLPGYWCKDHGDYQTMT